MWAQFRDAMVQRFEPVTEVEEASKQLRALRQTGGVRVGKSRYTKELLAAQAIRSTSLHRKPRRREDQKSHSTHSTDHIQREKAPMAMFHSYIIMYINVISLGPSQFPHLRLQSNYIYNIIYLFPVPAALHCPILCSTKAHALQSPLLILSIALNALIILSDLLLGILEVLLGFPRGFMCRVTSPKH